MRNRYETIYLLCVFSCSIAYAQPSPISFHHVIVDSHPPKDPWIKITGDFNGDGFSDLILGGQNGPIVGYAYPDWQKWPIGEGGYHTVDGEMGDIDRDGDMDIVVGAEFWYENPLPTVDPSKKFWKVHPISDLRTHDIELGDLDADGDLDLVARDQSGFGYNTGNKIHFWQQNSPDSWSYRAIECPHGEGLTLGDIDRDGDLDAIAGNRWYENTQTILTGSWKEYMITPEWHPDTVVQLGDLNGDGYEDVVLTRSEGPYKISWFEAPGDARHSPWKEHAIDATLDFAHALKLSDMDGDGDLDVVTAEMHQSERHRVLVYFNDKNGILWKPVILSKTGSHAMRLIDVDRDGKMDILGANWSGDYQAVELWINEIAQRTQRISTQSGEITIYPIQHASFVMQWNSQTLYVDPVGDPSLYQSFPRASWILLTHEHGDHLNETTLNGISNQRTKIIAPMIVKEKLGESNRQRVLLMANGDKKTVDSFQIEAVPMYNITPERLPYHGKGKGNGYVLTLDGKRIYISGDTEGIPEILALQNIDVAFLCMNLPYTMTVEQAAQVARTLKPRMIYPYHYRGSDINRFKELVGDKLGIEVRLLDWYAK